MNRILQLSEKIKDKREVELSTGDLVEFKDFLSINEIRAVSQIIASSSLKVREGETLFRVDPSLRKVAECFGFIKYLTDIDVSEANLDELTDGLVKTGLYKEIYENLNQELVTEIRSLTQNYIDEELRIQKLGGMLGYKLEEIFTNITLDANALTESVKNLNEDGGFVDKLKELEKTREINRNKK